MVPAAAHLLDRGWAQFQKTMKNLIKKSEIGPIKGFDPSYGWYLVKKYESKNGPLVAKILSVTAKHALNKVAEIRSNNGLPTELTIYKSKK